MSRPRSKLSLRKRIDAGDRQDGHGGHAAKHARGLPKVEEGCQGTARHAPAAGPEHPRPPLAGTVGLLNLGDTCFINAVLQALFHTAPVREALSLCASRVHTPAPHPLFAALSRCFFRMQGAAANGWPVVNPEDVVEEVRREAGGARFSCGQHDAHEFLLFLLNLCPEQPARRTERGRGDDARAAREPGGGMAGGEGRAAHAQRPSEEHRPGWSVPHTDGACECTKASNVEEVMQDGGGLRSLVGGEVVHAPAARPKLGGNTHLA